MSADLQGTLGTVVVQVEREHRLRIVVDFLEDVREDFERRIGEGYRERARR